jgi:hypothetical protein
MLQQSSGHCQRLSLRIVGQNMDRRRCRPRPPPWGSRARRVSREGAQLFDVRPPCIQNSSCNFICVLRRLNFGHSFAFDSPTLDTPARLRRQIHTDFAEVCADRATGKNYKSQLNKWKVSIYCTSIRYQHELCSLAIDCDAAPCRAVWGLGTGCRLNPNVRGNRSAVIVFFFVRRTGVIIARVTPRAAHQVNTTWSRRSTKWRLF